MPTREEVRAIARLARLSFTDAELDRMAGDLRAILAGAGELRAITASAGAASAGAASAGMVSIAGAGQDTAELRADVPGADTLAVPPSHIAPDWRDGFFVVPRLPAHEHDTT